MNIYHITVAKTASQWFREFLYKIRGNMRIFNYEKTIHKGWDHRKFTHRKVECPIPENTICVPLYMSFDNYHHIPKPEHHKAFCVWRDPRDVTVSFYFSCRYTHPQIGQHPKWRKELKKRNLEKGLIWTIDLLKDNLEIYQALESYFRCQEDPLCKIFTYANLFGKNHRDVIAELINWIEIEVPPKRLDKLLKKISFKHQTGRNPGTENFKKHLRKGIAGDWKCYFTPKVEKHFWAKNNQYWPDAIRP